MAASETNTVIDWEKAVVHDHNYPKMHMFHARKVMFANSSRPLPIVHLFSTNEVADDAYESSPKKLKLDPAEGNSSQGHEDDDEELDIMTTDKVPDLPYDESKVRSVMVECEKYVSLVRLVAKHHHQEEMWVSCVLFVASHSTILVIPCIKIYMCIAYSHVPIM